MEVMSASSEVVSSHIFPPVISIDLSDEWTNAVFLFTFCKVYLHNSSRFFVVLIIVGRGLLLTPFTTIHISLCVVVYGLEVNML